MLTPVSVDGLMDLDTRRSPETRREVGRRNKARVGARAGTVQDMGIVDDLLQNPGLYLGIDHDTAGRGEAAARILVTPLPGRAGVTLDYETFNPANRDRIRGHHEHAVVARQHAGPAVLVTGHIHAESVSVLHEAGPGVFELAEEAPFPMKITISMPEPGRLVHSWWYGAPGETAQERDRAELRLQSES